MSKKRNSDRPKNNTPYEQNDIKDVLETSSEITREKLLANSSKAQFKIEYRTETQKEFWNAIEQNEITLCIGPAGTGKSTISVLKAFDLVVRQKRYKHIWIVKPVVESGEKIGYLPGTLEEKLEPYIYSIKYLFSKLIGEKKTKAFFDDGIIKVQALAYMRGINIDNTVVIMDEAQNMNHDQMKMLLTRLGENSKFIISGDIEQIDRFKSIEESGLYYAFQKIKPLSDKIGLIEFNSSEIVRNPLISYILECLK